MKKKKLDSVDIEQTNRGMDGAMLCCNLCKSQQNMSYYLRSNISIW